MVRNSLRPDEILGLLAAAPAEPRDHSRLLVVDRRTGAIEHRRFFEIGRYLRPGDCLVLNKTKVLSCRLVGRKSTGGRAELLILGRSGPCFRALGQKLKDGAIVELPRGENAKIVGSAKDGELLVKLSASDPDTYLEEIGLPPLPPYIIKARRMGNASPRPDSDHADKARYQTVYAEEPGAVAAPTAGLHFTRRLIDEIRGSGVHIAEIVLHVGLGTFKPVTAGDAALHQMLPEPYRVGAAAADAIQKTIQAGGRVVAVGTSVVRTLETLARRPEGLSPGEGESALYIHPGVDFKAVSGLITNFHLPRSTPLLLAAAFLGRERLLASYREAFKERYRLFSYGDAMLIL